jgi:hypothetical protein
MTAPRAMTAAFIGLPTKSQGEPAFLRRQRVRCVSGTLAGGGGGGRITASALRASCSAPS